MVTVAGWRQYGMDLPAYHFLAGVAEHLFRSGIPIECLAAGIDHHHGIECRVTNRANPLFTLLQRRFNTLAFGDVTKELDEARASTVRNRFACDVGMKNGAVFSQDGGILVDPNVPRRLSLEFLQDGGQFLGGMDVHDRQGQQLLLRVAEHLTDCRIRPNETLRFDIGDEQTVHHAIVDGLEFVVAVSRSFAHGPSSWR